MQRLPLNPLTTAQNTWLRRAGGFDLAAAVLTIVTISVISG